MRHITGNSIPRLHQLQHFNTLLFHVFYPRLSRSMLTSPPDEGCYCYPFLQTNFRTEKCNRIVKLCQSQCIATFLTDARPSLLQFQLLARSLGRYLPTAQHFQLSRQHVVMPLLLLKHNIHYKCRTISHSGYIDVCPSNIQCALNSRTDITFSPTLECIISTLLLSLLS